MKYIDLFAGIGGFAAALNAMGGIGAYAVEKDKNAARVYELNWGHNPLGDITQDANELVVNVPPHDILAAGFPCQPFSKSGAQMGMRDKTRGTLFHNIMNIVEHRKPTIVMLENVRNLAGPSHSDDWDVIVQRLIEAGYRVNGDRGASIFSPHKLRPELGGRPQNRERVFIMAIYDPVNATRETSFRLSENDSFNFNPLEWDLERDLLSNDADNDPALALSSNELHVIEAWDAWIKILRSNGEPLPGFPVWSDAWVREPNIPQDTPAWKRNFLLKNSDLYIRHKKQFDEWREAWHLSSDIFTASTRKLEWQAQDTESIWDCVLHLRPSGVRAKKPNYLPALVAITQTPILAFRKRRLSVDEARKLQGLPDSFTFEGQSSAQSYKQLGNGVNVGVVWNVLKIYVQNERETLQKSEAGKRILNCVEGAPSSPDLIKVALRKN